MKELLAKLYNHGLLVSAGIETTSALRATFGEDILKETECLEAEINQLDKIFNN